MPFTFSHPAIVLPLLFIDKRKFSVAALTIGSITPDFGYFLYIPSHLNYSHTWLGILWFNLPLSLILFYLFQAVVKEQLINNLPLFLYSRFAKYKRVPNGPYNLAIFFRTFTSLLIGITSHIVWDRITHKGAWLADDRTEFYRLLWDTNSIIGALVIAFMIFNLPKVAIERKPRLLLFWLPVVFVITLFLFYRIRDTLNNTSLVVAAISGLFLGILVSSIISLIVQVADSNAGKSKRHH